jgi:hypothetical protein
VFVVKAHHCVEVEAREDVAVADDDAFVDALGREAHRAGRAEGFVFDRVAHDDVAEPVVALAVGREVLVERVGQVPHREHDLVDAVRREPRELTLEVGLIGDR